MHFDSVHGHLHLTPSQAFVYNLSMGARVLIKGPAGSGKTTVAIARAIHCACFPDLLSDPDGKILILAYNRELVDHALNPEIEHHANTISREKLKVLGLHQYANQFARVQSPDQEARLLYKAVTDQHPKPTLNSEVNEAFLTAFSPPSSSKTVTFYRDEINWIIDEMIQTKEEYLTCERTGRGAHAILDTGRPIVRKEIERPLIWDVYTRFIELCEENNVVTYGLSVQKALPIAQKMGPVYTHVIIDEAQDFSPLWFRLALSQIDLTNPMCGITIIASDRQQIYRKNASWKKRLGLDGVRLIRLMGNHRNPQDIAWLAESFYRSIDDPNDDEQVPSYPQPKDIKNIQWIHGPNLEKIIQHLETSFGKTDLTILAPDRKTMATLPSNIAKWHSATWRIFKGSEAGTVILFNLSNEKLRGFEIQESDPEQFLSNVKLLYTMITRAKERLVLVTQDGLESSLLNKLLEIGNAHIEEVIVNE